MVHRAGKPIATGLAYVPHQLLGQVVLSRPQRHTMSCLPRNDCQCTAEVASGVGGCAVRELQMVTAVGAAESRGQRRSAEVSGCGKSAASVTAARFVCNVGEEYLAEDPDTFLFVLLVARLRPSGGRQRRKRRKRRKRDTPRRGQLQHGPVRIEMLATRPDKTASSFDADGKPPLFFPLEFPEFQGAVCNPPMPMYLWKVVRHSRLFVWKPPKQPSRKRILPPKTVFHLWGSRANENGAAKPVGITVETLFAVRTEHHRSQRKHTLGDRAKQPSALSPAHGPCQEPLI